jgi:hypothetical protein
LNSFAEDVKLASLARRHRLKFGVARAGSLGGARFREPSESLRRTGYRLILLDRSALIAVTLGAAALVLWPIAILLVSWEFSDLSVWGLRLGPLLIAFPWYRSPLAILLPIAVYPAVAYLWSGLIAALIGHGIDWKGRSI